MELSPVDQLVAHVRSRLGGRVVYAGRERCDELVRLVVQFWPRRHLESAAAAGPNSRAITHALTLMRAQVRERWELRHGVGPLWDLVLGGTVTASAHVVLELWLADRGWRANLAAMARELATRDPVD